MTHSPAIRGAFKTPTLREAARTAPYMHDGSLPTLESVVEFDHGGGEGRRRVSIARFVRCTSRRATRRISWRFLHALTGRVQDGM